MERLLIVTSRAPFSYRSQGEKDIKVPNVGGVATALNRVLKKYGGTWVCWGDSRNDGEHREEEVGGYTIRRIYLTATEKLGFYNNYSNRVLWPLFHYFRNNIQMDATGFKYYYIVNEKFSKAIMEKIDSKTTIWVHDYQLMMIPSILRNMGVHNNIIFSWHIPWVSPEFFSIIPEGKFLARSVSKANLVTFHTRLYEKNFRSTLEYNNIKLVSHLKTLSVPLGIDTKIYTPLTGKHGLHHVKRVPIIFSIDRMDYTKGLIQRVKAIDKVLSSRSDLSGKFVYLMNVTPSRAGIPEYDEIKNRLEMEIGRVNGLYSTSTWIPIVYMYHKIPFKSLLNLYSSGDIALITPLVDGLNLVSKEFVATTRKGILILSKFAGAADGLKGALIVNPNNINEIASSIVRALEMSSEERRLRLEKMKKYVVSRNSNWWYRRIINAAESNYDNE
jgi:trehalose 6-phosphate synthase/phosphatase